MAANESDQEPLEEDGRVSALEKRLKQAQDRERDKARHRVRSPDENQRLGMRVLSYLVGGVVVGFGIGWILDRLFETSPLFLLLFFFFGIGTAFWRIYQISSQPVDDIGSAVTDEDE